MANRVRQGLLSLRFTVKEFRGDIYQHPSCCQEKSDQWFSSFTSVIITSVYFQTFTFLRLTPVLMNQNLPWGERTQKGRMQEYAFFFFFASFPSYSCVHWNSNPKRKSHIVVIFICFSILAFNKLLLCTYYVPGSVFSIKYTRLKQDGPCPQGIHNTKGEKWEQIKGNSTVWSLVTKMVQISWRGTSNPGSGWGRA